MEEGLSLASKIRKFFEDLFGSRLVEQLTMDLVYARNDMERMRQEYQGIIAELRAEKAQLETRMIMYDSRFGLRPINQTPIKPVFDFSSIPPMKTRWQTVVEENEKQIARELAEEEEQKKKGVATAT